MSRTPRLALAAAIMALVANGVLAMSSVWQNKRVFIVFADATDPRVDAQTSAILAHRDGIADRDMVAIAVIGGDVKMICGDAPAGMDANALRARYQVEAGSSFTALLIGKDGGVKWREQRPADPDELFALIDTMPMRRQEMSRQ